MKQNQADRYGRWNQKRMTVPKGRGQTYLVWSCSLCKSKEKKRSRFCPNCGKPMYGFNMIDAGDKSNTNVYKNPVDSGEMSYEDYDKWKEDHGE